VHLPGAQWRAQKRWTPSLLSGAVEGTYTGACSTPLAARLTVYPSLPPSARIRAVPHTLTNRSTLSTKTTAPPTRTSIGSWMGADSPVTGRNCSGMTAVRAWQ